MAERGNGKLKALDRYVGIPTVFALGLTKRRKNEVPAQVFRIGILEIAAIGDALLIALIIGQLRKSYPRVRIEAFPAANNHSAFGMLEGIDRVKEMNLNNPLACISLIRASGPFDVWLDFGQWPRINPLFTHFAQAGFKIGFKTRGRHHVYDLVVAHSREGHEIENNLNLVKPLGIVSLHPASIPAPAAKNGADHVIVHMFPGWTKQYLKEWPEASWVKVIGHLASLGRKVFLTGVDSDRIKAERIRRGCSRSDRVEVVAGAMTLKECSELMYGASLVISVNTGIMHMASLLGRNLVVLNGPTSGKRWGPLNGNSISIQSPLPCSPCLNLGFEYGCDQNLCMRGIRHEAVIAPSTSSYPRMQSVPAWKSQEGSSQCIQGARIGTEGISRRWAARRTGCGRA